MNLSNNNKLPCSMIGTGKFVQLYAVLNSCLATEKSYLRGSELIFSASSDALSKSNCPVILDSPVSIFARTNGAEISSLLNQIEIEMSVPASS